MTQPLIAVTHASSLLAEELLPKMVESGIKPDSVVLLDNTEVAGSRLAYADTYLTVSDQMEYDYEDLAAVLLLQADAELESLLQHCDCFVVSHHLDGNRAGLYLSADKLPAQPCPIKLPSPEIGTLMPFIHILEQIAGIRSLQIVNVLSAALLGKAGVNELATQTINLLSGRDIENHLFPLQLAFNILPSASNAELEYQLERVAGSGVLCSINNVLVPAMHGMAISVAIELNSSIELNRLVEGLSSIDGVIVADHPVSSLTHSKTGTDMMVFNLNQPQNDAKRLHFWIIADSIRNGLVPNYQNILEILLKSFL